jgi:hypothetical protein
MDIFLALVRGLLVSIALLLSLIYILVQLFQKVPNPPFQLKTYEYILLGVVGFMFALGFDSYYGLLGVVPLVLWKGMAHLQFKKSRLSGKGTWIEMEWRKLTPKGFALPKEMLNEMGKLPGDNHFIIPRFFTLLGLKLVHKNINKSMGKLPPHMKGQEGAAVQMIEGMVLQIKTLDSGKSHTLNLPFGVLKVTRL